MAIWHENTDRLGKYNVVQKDANLRRCDQIALGVFFATLPPSVAFADALEAIEASW